MPWLLHAGSRRPLWKKGEIDPLQGATVRSLGVRPYKAVSRTNRAYERQQRAQEPREEQTVEDS